LIQSVIREGLFRKDIMISLFVLKQHILILRAGFGGLTAANAAKMA
jgi:hypothetical protein